MLSIRVREKKELIAATRSKENVEYIPKSQVLPLSQNVGMWFLKAALDDRVILDLCRRA